MGILKWKYFNSLDLGPEYHKDFLDQLPAKTTQKVAWALELIEDND
jgi:hypothetical protein